jgi:hypothetical protein
MNWESLKTRLEQELAETKIRLEERELYQKLKERWDSLNSLQKKLSLIGLAFIGFLALTIPIYSSYSDSQEILSEFESKRDLMRTLMLTQKDLSEVGAPTSSISADSLRFRIQNEILQDGLLPEQNGGILDFNDFKGSQMFPEQIVQAGLELSLKQITIRQLVQISTRLESLSEQIKIRDLIVRSDLENKGYINATIRLLIFKISDPSILAPPPPQSPKRGGK